MDRRIFLEGGLSSIFLTNTGVFEPSLKKELLKPKALKIGDTIGMVCPAFSANSIQEVELGVEAFEKMGFKVKVGKHLYDNYGYLAGKDKDRAADINDFFNDTNINGIVAMHGGWGCARVLPLLDYEMIEKNPKVFMGYSDLTALVNGIYAKTGLVTFHGPVGSSTFNAFSVNYFKKTVMNGEKTFMQNPIIQQDSLVQTKDRTWTINKGQSTGKLIGGNLTVLTNILGSAYVPDFKGAILFLEDIGENIYRIDRMLTQLALNGILNQISGFVFGKCTDCTPSEGGYGSLTLEEVFLDHIKPLNIPAFSGAMIGHIENKFTVPIGIKAKIDANLGTIELLEKAVD